MDGATALHAAAGAGDVGMVEALLQAGADARARLRKSHSTPLLSAAARGHARVVEALLEGAGGAQDKALLLSDLDSSGGSALHASAVGGHVEALRLLTAAAAAAHLPGLINLQDSLGRSPLHACAGLAACTPPTVHALLAAGASALQCAGAGGGSAAAAVVAGTRSLADKQGLLSLLVKREGGGARQVLGAGACPGGRGSPLLLAVRTGSAGLVRAVLEAAGGLGSGAARALVGAASGGEEGEGEGGALGVAVRAGSVDIVRLLVENGARAGASVVEELQGAVGVRNRAEMLKLVLAD